MLAQISIQINFGEVNLFWFLDLILLLLDVNTCTKPRVYFLIYLSPVKKVILNWLLISFLFYTTGP